MADRARLIAHRTLQAVSLDEAYANLVLPRLLGEAHLSARDAALATELSYGTLRASGTLDEVIRRCSSRALADVELGVLNALRLGAYQLLKTRIPPHAAVATTVDLLRSTGNARAAGFGNAVLRAVSRADYEQWCARVSEGASELGRLAVRHAHPGWIVGAFAQALEGEGRADELERALAADDERPVTHLVGWPGRVTQSELAGESGGEPGPYSPYAVRLVNGGEPGSFSSVAEQHAGVQDEGSQLCAIAITELPLLGGPDERWLDLCAGPGGKAALLAALAGQRGAKLTANELHPHRAELITRATEGWPVEVRVGDARRYARGDDQGDHGDALEPFDRVLLDAPCTGLGALRRRPEARWRKGPDDLVELIRLQGQLLDAAVRLVRPGGVIGYVTCSPHPAETSEQVAAVLARHPELELLDARPAFPDVDKIAEASTVQLWPHRHGTDAMFFAGLRRRP